MIKHKQQIEKAEEEERLKKEKEAEKLKETGKKVEQVNEPEETPTATPDEVVEELPESPDQHADAVEDADFGNEFEQDGSDVSNQASGLNEVKEETFENTESISKEELGRVVASRWTGQHSDDHTEELHHTGHIEDDDDSDTPENGSDDEYDGYHLDSGGHDRTYGDDMEPDSLEEDDDAEEHVDHDISSSSDFEDATKISDLSVIGASSWLDKFRQSFQAVLQSLKLFKTPVNTSDASRIRKEYDDYSGKLLKMQSRISSLSEKLKTDFGGWWTLTINNKHSALRTRRRGTCSLRQPPMAKMDTEMKICNDCIMMGKDFHLIGALLDKFLESFQHILEELVSFARPASVVLQSCNMPEGVDFAGFVLGKLGGPSQWRLPTVHLFSYFSAASGHISKGYHFPIEGVAIIPSKCLRNKIIGFSTHLMKCIQQGRVHNISLKLQEEERECPMDFMPDESAIPHRSLYPELQDKLDSMNEGRMEGHDEL
ncbi:Glucosidase 2 subunit beta [Nymphaea thermarum]|nr:Glucosidase 2 subunit beta [Nymphaea thermarum]